MADLQFVNFSELYRELDGASSKGEAGEKPLDSSIVHALVALVNSAYRGDSSKAGWTTEADLLEGQRTDAAEVQRLLEEPNEALLGVIDPTTQTPLACVRLRRDSVAMARRDSGPVIRRDGGPVTSRDSGHMISRDVGPTAYLGMLTVSPTLQSRGMGRSLLEHAERFCRSEWRAEEIHMTVISVRRSLIDWYVRRGYTLTEEFQNFPYGDARFGIPLRDDLRFQVLRKRLV